MTGYTRVYNESTGQTVEASDFNTEFQSIDDAFDESTGHKHDGSNDEGAYVPLISDSDNNNSVEIDTGNNEIDFSVEVSSSKTRQMVLTDGALLPDTDDDLDLGSATYQFKDAYIDGTANIDSLVADTADINGGTIDGATIGGSSAGAGTFTNLMATGTVTLPADSVDTDDIAAGALPSDVTVNDGNWSGTDLAVANGGTGSSTASGARTALGLAIGSDVQAHDAQLDDIAALAVTNGNFIVGDGVNWVAESGATARSSLGLGSIATQNSSSVSITGGSIAGIADLAVADGGTGASTASGARTNLGVTATGSDTTYNYRANNLSDVASAATAFSNIKQAATTSATGVVEVATSAEAQAGTDTTRSISPSTLRDALVAGTAQATTSGTAFDFTSIPSWVKRITVMFNGVSLSGTDFLLVQIGDSGGIETTGYTATSGRFIYTNATGGDNSTSGYPISTDGATETFSGHLVISNISGNIWVSSHSGGSTDVTIVGGGTKTLSSTLDRIRITRSGTDTFDAGSVNIMYE